MYRLHSGSKLLAGIWSHSADSGRSLFELFDDGLSDRTNRDASLDVSPASEQYDMKYYTPFGSGVSLGDLAHGQHANKSCWNTEPSEGRNGVIGKPLPVTSATNKINTDKFHTVTERSDIVIKASSNQPEDCSMAKLSGYTFEQPRSNRNADKACSNTVLRNSKQRDTVGCQSFSNYHAVKTPSSKLMGIPGDSKCIAVEHREKQLMANQQMFMHELNRLPPDLRKQYVDYMIASHLGVLPTVPAVPAVYYNVAVGPSAVPVTPLIARPVIVPTGPLMPPSLYTVMPSHATKSQSR